MHNLILNKIKLNDNIDDHFEDLQKRHHNIFDDSEITKDKGFDDIKFYIIIIKLNTIYSFNNSFNYILFKQRLIIIILLN